MHEQVEGDAKKIGAMAAYRGGSKIAVGSTHIELKSLVNPGKEYIIRGVDTTETVPQHMRMRNFTTSAAASRYWQPRPRGPQAPLRWAPRRTNATRGKLPP